VTRGTLALFHAYGDTPAALSGTADRLARATGLEPRLLEGPRVLRGDEAGGRAWTGYESDDARQLARVRARLVRELSGVRRLCLFGFSQGGMVALELALASPLRVEAVVTVGAFLAPAGLARPRARTKRDALPPLLLLHGDADDAVPRAESERALARARELGCAARLEAFRGGHEVTRAVERAAARFLRATSSSGARRGRPARRSARPT
jgi:predicted esterase